MTSHISPLALSSSGHRSTSSSSANSTAQHHHYCRRQAETDLLLPLFSSSLHQSPPFLLPNGFMTLRIIVFFSSQHHTLLRRTGECGTKQSQANIVISQSPGLSLCLPASPFHTGQFISFSQPSVTVLHEYLVMRRAGETNATITSSSGSYTFLVILLILMPPKLKHITLYLDSEQNH